jgi:hypothetical protein
MVVTRNSKIGPSVSEGNIEDSNTGLVVYSTLALIGASEQTDAALQKLPEEIQSPDGGNAEETSLIAAERLGIGMANW